MIRELLDPSSLEMQGCNANSGIYYPKMDDAIMKGILERIYEFSAT